MSCKFSENFDEIALGKIKVTEFSGWSFLRQIPPRITQIFQNFSSRFSKKYFGSVCFLQKIMAMNWFQCSQGYVFHDESKSQGKNWNRQQNLIFNNYLIFMVPKDECRWLVRSQSYCACKVDCRALLNVEIRSAENTRCWCCWKRKWKIGEWKWLNLTRFATETCFETQKLLLIHFWLLCGCIVEEKLGVITWNLVEIKSSQIAK